MLEITSSKSGAEKTGLGVVLSETPKTGFVVSMPNYDVSAYFIDFIEQDKINFMFSCNIFLLYF